MQWEQKEGEKQAQNETFNQEQASWKEKLGAWLETLLVAAMQQANSYTAHDNVKWGDELKATARKVHHTA